MPDEEPVRPVPVVDAAPHEDSGGEGVCWLPLLCPTCGALTEDRTAACWRCGAPPEGAAPRADAAR